MQLSPGGRQEFGNWLSNRLAIAAGGTVALVLVPAVAGKMALPNAMITGGCIGVVAFAALAGLIKYLTVERAGESIGSPEKSHG